MNETDPIDLAFGADGDLDLTGGDLVFTFGAEGVAQLLDERFRQVRGDLFVNEAEGIPYFENDQVTASEAIIGRRFNRLATLSAYRQTGLSTPGVTGIQVTASFNADTRELTVEYNAQTIFGVPVSNTIVRAE